MIEISGAALDVEVQPAEYVRLLGYPAGTVLAGRAAELAAEAREWYANHGRPWVYVRHASSLQIGDDAVVVDGVAFHSTRLRNTLDTAGAHGAVLAAVSAGPELETEAQARWRDEKPDEYFFLEVYGSAVVEHLATGTGARLCAWADARGAHGNVNHSAHFWGAAFGIAFALVVEPRLIGIFTDRLLAPLG